jgi:hypothetical protein
VIFDKYPLSVYARVEQVYIDGQLYFSRERDQQRQKAIEADKKRLAELDQGSPPSKPAAPTGDAGARADSNAAARASMPVKHQQPPTVHPAGHSGGAR